MEYATLGRRIMSGHTRSPWRPWRGDERQLPVICDLRVTAGARQSARWALTPVWPAERPRSGPAKNCRCECCSP